jgi:hypothetical protein
MHQHASWLLGLALAACASEAPAPVTGPPDAGVEAAAGPVTAAVGYNGALAVGRPDPGGGDERVIELSAPILPDVELLYPLQVSWPADPAALAAAAEAAALVYPDLLVACAPLYPGITLVTPERPTLTPEELATNYNVVAQCSYEQYWAKPYWIPAVVHEVDLCGRCLGAGWRLVTEQDALGFSEAELQAFADTLTAMDGGWGAFYFSLSVYVRRTDGSLGVADLYPGTQTRLRDVSPDFQASHAHYESNLALRCVEER